MFSSAKSGAFLFSLSVVMISLGCAIGYGQSMAELRTPKPPAAPRINGPKVYGARPGHPFLYRIPCTGTRPIRFAAIGLPASLKLDANSGIISGQTLTDTGEFALTLEASNAHGKTSRPFKIVVGATDRKSVV